MGKKLKPEYKRKSTCTYNVSCEHRKEAFGVHCRKPTCLNNVYTCPQHHPAGQDL